MVTYLSCDHKLQLYLESYYKQFSSQYDRGIIYDHWAVVVAQLVEQSLPTPEVRGSNPVISKKLN